MRARFFEPEPTPFGNRLRSTLPPARKPVFHALSDENAWELRRRCEHAASVLPESMVSRILDGFREGSSSQVSAATRVSQVATALSAHAGADGRALRPKLATLARLVDFGWYKG